MKLVLLAAAGSVLATTPAPAQTTGAFNMGLLTGTVSQDAVTQSEERRAKRSRGARRATARSQRESDCTFLRKRVDQLTDEQYSIYRQGCLR